MHRLRRIAAYAWPSAYTLTGIALGLLLSGRFRQVAGVIEVHGPRVARVLDWMPTSAAALTFGHVVFGQTQSALDLTRSHERIHVRQYERWGIAFVPAYLLVSVFIYLRGRDGYRENPFEIEAYQNE